MPLKIPKYRLPAGFPDKMRAHRGVDAETVYAGQPGHCSQTRNNELRLEQIQTGIWQAQRVTG